VKCYDRRNETGYSTGREILTSVEKQLEELEKRFQQDFDQQLSASRHGPVLPSSQSPNARRTSQSAQKDHRS
jgi:hypothetical protein